MTTSRKRRLLLYLRCGSAGLAIFFLGMAIIYTGLVRPGGWPQLGAIVAIMGVLDAIVRAAAAQEAWEERDRQAAVKRFWKDGRRSSREGDGWTIKLDGRPVRTPARAALAVPTKRWPRRLRRSGAGSRETIDPRAMPLTGLANAAIDRVAPDRHAFADGLARYAEADLACYRAEGPRALAERQARLGHAARLGAAALRRGFRDHVRADARRAAAATVERLAHAVAALDAFRLAGLSPLVTIGGSLVAALGRAREGGDAPRTRGTRSASTSDGSSSSGARMPRRRAALDEPPTASSWPAARFLELLDASEVLPASTEAPADDSRDERQAGLAHALRALGGDDRADLARGSRPCRG